MTHQAILLLAGATLLVSACGGSAPAANTPATDGANAAGATDASPPVDGSSAATDGSTGEPGEGNATKGDAIGKGESPTASPPKPAAPKTRIEQCQVLGTGMQQVQQVGPIANAGDGTKLLVMAKQLRVESEALAKAQLALPGLAELRDQYVGTTNEMATALEEAAATTKAAEQKAAVARFRKLEPTLSDHMTRLNEICNAPRK